MKYVLYNTAEKKVYAGWLFYGINQISYYVSGEHKTFDTVTDASLEIDWVREKCKKHNRHFPKLIVKPLNELEI